jgi:hypothetical protein
MSRLERNLKKLSISRQPSAAWVRDAQEEAIEIFDFRLSTFDFRLSTWDLRLEAWDLRLETCIENSVRLSLTVWGEQRRSIEYNPLFWSLTSYVRMMSIVFFGKFIYSMDMNDGQSSNNSLPWMPPICHFTYLVGTKKWKPMTLRDRSSMLLWKCIRPWDPDCSNPPSWR